MIDFMDNKNNNTTESTEMEKDKLTEKIIGCAIEVHRTLGPGLMESTYEKCLAHEFSLNNIAFQKQLSMPVNYKGINLDCGYRIDLLIENLA